MAKNKDSLEEVENNKFQSVDFKWLCPNCRFLLGFIDYNAITVRMKYRDFYVTVTGGDVACTCRRCGKIAILTQNKDPEVDPITGKPIIAKAVKR
jgi:RNase P subunit RPR2